MSGFRFKKALLPAALVFAGVFTILNLSFSAQKTNPLLAKIIFLGNRDLKPTAIGADGNLMIRYVGLTIMISVGASAASIEAFRRLQRSRARKQQLQEQFLKINHLLASSPEANSPEVEEPPFLAESLYAEQPPNFSTDVFKAFPSVTLDPNPDQLTQAKGFNEPDLAYNQLCSHCSAHTRQVHLNEPYQICRIKVPYRRQQLLAVFSNGQYYRFVKSEIDRDRACAVAATRIQRGEQPVITNAPKGYAVWVFEPEAALAE